MRGPDTLDGGEQMQGPALCRDLLYITSKPTLQQNDSCSIFRTNLGPRMDILISPAATSTRLWLCRQAVFEARISSNNTFMARTGTVG